MQPERWLEGELRRDVSGDRCAAGCGACVYAGAGVCGGGPRDAGSAVGDEDGRLAVIELKADEDLHLALQGLDYWVRVRWHHLQNPDAATGLGEFQRHGYFGGVRLARLRRGCTWWRRRCGCIRRRRWCCGICRRGWSGRWWRWMSDGGGR